MTTSDECRYRVRVLGPLAVTRDGTAVDLGGPKQRLTLALLLVQLDRVVSVDRLIEGVWGDDPPPTARKAVQVNVSNLRRLLGEGFPLRTAPGGYVLQSEGLDIDGRSFERAVEEATARLRTDPAAAARQLSDAVACWVGGAYSDLAGEAALEPEVARLSELRLQAIERRIDAELRVGRHSEVIGELETLTAEHPYRERLIELQMLALYRCGRQTEALRAYQRVRSTLVEDLGVEPGPRLQELERQVLDHSSELDLAEQEDDRYAFLATDIESSTAMWEEDPEAMESAVARHDELLSRSVSNNAGTVFKGTGDGVFAVFADVSDALQAAVDAQVALAAEPWSTDRPVLVRMGVDAGRASARNGDYFGPVLNRVSRVMASAHGGQIVCPVEVSAHASVPTRPLGGADYRGIGRLEIAQLEVPGLPADFPDLRTDRAPKTTVREGFGRAIRGYELRERLGEGAHGVVYRAFQSGIGREVAIKVIRPEHSNRTEFVKRFEAEAQYVAQLEHPHIVSLYDYWRDPDGAYLVLQLMRGGSLATSLDRAPWNPPAALKLLEQVGGALDYAHRHGVMHHDLKPENVLLDGEGNAFLTDFGIASQQVEAFGLPNGSSAAYVAPEEIAGGQVTLAADMYGLGLLTHEILTGDRPELGAQPEPTTDRRHDLPPGLDQVIARATDPDPTRRFARVDDFLRAVRRSFGTDVFTHERRDRAVEVRNPYKGLRAFSETDAHDFFGRDDLCRELLEHVSTNRLTAVVGPSGSGKSSLVRAGLLPLIRRRAAASDGSVLVTDMFPGSYPFEELESALLRIAVDRPEGVLAELLSDDRGLLRMSKQLLPNDDSELLLVIDQFEELFLLTQDGATRQRFLDNLVTAVDDERSRIRIVVTMRADHFDRPLAEAGFGALMRAAVVPVSAPSRDELQRAIALPAAGAGLEFEPGLITRIVGDVVGEPGALPLMQYALTELVAARRGTELSVDGYDSIGGVSGALARRAEEIYAGLPDASKDAAREVFLRLVNVVEEGDDTRRRVRRTELEVLGLPHAAVDDVLDAYGSFRLLSFDRDPVTRGPTVEVAHEALVREWPRYRGWVDERREDLVLRRRLETASDEWSEGDHDPSFLFAGGQLEQYEQWARRTDLRLSDTEREFLAQSRGGEDRARAQRRRARGAAFAAISAVAVVALIAAGIAWLQRDEAREAAAAEQDALGQAETARDEALVALGDAESARADATAALDAEATARQLGLARFAASQAREVLRSDQDLGVLLAVAASDLLASTGIDEPGAAPEVMQALFDASTRHRALRRLRVERPTFYYDCPATFCLTGPAPEPTISSDASGTRLAVIEPSESEYLGRVVRISELESGAPILELEVLLPVSVLWDTVEDRVLVGTADGVLASFDPISGDRVDLVTGLPGPVLVHAADAATLTYVVHDSELGAPTSVVIDRATANTIKSYPRTFHVELAPDGGSVVIYDVVDGFIGGDDALARIESFPDGAPIATTATNNLFGWTSDGMLLIENRGLLQRVLIDGTVDAETQVVSSPLNTMASAAVSPTGALIAIEGAHGAIHIYDAATLELVEGLDLGDGSDVVGLAWSGDGRRVIGVDGLGDTIIWDLGEGRRAPDTFWTDVETDMTYLSGPTESIFLSGSLRGAWEAWDVETGARITGGGEDARLDLGSVALNADRGVVGVSRGPGQGIDIVSVADGEVIAALPADYDEPLQFSPDATRLVVGTNSASVARGGYDGFRFALYDVTSGQRLFEHPAAPGKLPSFSADGALVALPWGFPGTAGAGALLVDASTGERLAAIEVLGDAGFSSAFSPDGRVLAVGTWLGSVELHDVTELLAGRESLIGRASTGRDEWVTSVSFSADGSTVIGGEVVARKTTAWSADAEMVTLWTLDDVGGGMGLEDGMLRLRAVGALPVDLGGRGSGLIRIPIDHVELADFVRGKATRTFTEAECATFFDSTCAEFQGLLG